MPKFQYVAWQPSGEQVAGVLDAPSRRDALGSLEAQELFPLSVSPAASVSPRFLVWRRRVAARHLVVFYRQLSDLLKSGVPLLRSLELLERQSHNPKLATVLHTVRERVADGTRLAEALREHPRVFSELAVSMVQAGEEGSFLEDVLRRIADFTEHQLELRSRVVGATIYPAFLLAAVTLIVSGMLVFFVPKFQPILDRMSEQGSLPWATTALMWVSSTVQSYWLVGLLIGGSAGYAVFSWLKTEAGRKRIDEFLIRGFGVGPIVRNLAIARFCRILGTLLTNGVPILRSLTIAKDATGNSILSRAIGEAAENISQGKSLAAPLATSRQFPEDIVEMISVGEEANNLEQVLLDIADAIERRTNRLLDIFVRLLEPVLLTIMAGVVLFVVVALLWPIMQSASVL